MPRGVLGGGFLKTFQREVNYGHLDIEPISWVGMNELISLKGRKECYKAGHKFIDYLCQAVIFLASTNMSFFNLSQFFLQ